MTVEAIAWHVNNPDDSSVIDIERFYSEDERKIFFNRSILNKTIQDHIDHAWVLLEEDMPSLQLMLTSWAKRNCCRNSAVHMVPTTHFAEDYIAMDTDFQGEMGLIARNYIYNGCDSYGDRFFIDK